MCDSAGSPMRRTNFSAELAAKIAQLSLPDGGETDAISLMPPLTSPAVTGVVPYYQLSIPPPLPPPPRRSSSFFSHRQPNYQPYVVVATPPALMPMTMMPTPLPAIHCVPPPLPPVAEDGFGSDSAMLAFKAPSARAQRKDREAQRAYAAAAEAGLNPDLKVTAHVEHIQVDPHSHELTLCVIVCAQNASHAVPALIKEKDDPRRGPTVVIAAYKAPSKLVAGRVTTAEADEHFAWAGHPSTSRSLSRPSSRNSNASSGKKSPTIQQAGSVRYMHGIHSVRGSCLLDGASSLTSLTPDAARRHLVQLNVEFPRARIVDARRSCLVSIKFAISLTALDGHQSQINLDENHHTELLFTVQIPIKWSRPSRFTLKRVPTADNANIQIRRQAFRDSTMDTTFKIAHPEQLSPVVPRGPAAGSMGGKLPISNSSLSSGRSSKSGSCSSRRHRRRLHVAPTGSGVLVKKTSTTRLGVSLDGKPLSAKSRNSCVQAQPMALRPPNGNAPAPVATYRKQRARLPSDWMTPGQPASLNHAQRNLTNLASNNIPASLPGSNSRSVNANYYHHPIAPHTQSLHPPSSFDDVGSLSSSFGLNSPIVHPRHRPLPQPPSIQSPFMRPLPIPPTQTTSSRLLASNANSNNSHKEIPDSDHSNSLTISSTLFETASEISTIIVRS